MTDDTVRYTIDFSVEQHRKFKAACSILGLSQAEVIRNFVDTFISVYELNKKKAKTVHTISSITGQLNTSTPFPKFSSITTKLDTP